MMQRLPCCWIAGAFLALLAGSAPRSTPAADVPQAVLDAERQRTEVIDRARRTAVSVFARGGQGGGSGVVVTPDGYALTNYHVAKPAGSYMKCSMADGQLYEAVIVGVDPVGDVALIKLLGRDDFPHAELGDSDEVRVGDWCFAVGNPFLLATDFQPTVTYGIVSGVRRYQYPAGTLLEYADCIQTDASINPGNSGGPLFDAQGRLIGVNGRGSFEKRGRVNVGVGYAISINQIKNFMGYLRSGRIVDHATLGANVSSDDEGRVLVTNILDTSDAYRRGLAYGDEIVAFGGRPVTTVNGFKNALGVFPKGWRVPLSYRRDGTRHDVNVRLTGVHAQEELLEKVQRSSRPPEQPGKPPQPRPGQPRRPGQPGPPGEPSPDQPPGDQQPRPRPLPLPQGRPAAAKVPDEIAKLIKPRSGYANYYFNELNRDRVWSAFTAGGAFDELSGRWEIDAELVGGGDVQFVLDEAEVAAQLPDGPVSLDLNTDLHTQLVPANSGGMLVSLYLWRRMLTLTPHKFGEVYYLGTAPLVGREGLFDVLTATHNVTESRFSFDSASGRLVALEMYPDTNVDPCELYFEDYREVDGRFLPHQIRVQYGDRYDATLQIKAYRLTKSEKNKA